VTMIVLFVIAFGVGCLTGIVAILATRYRRAVRSTHPPPLVALIGDDRHVATCSRPPGGEPAVAEAGPTRAATSPCSARQGRPQG
jgi:hypothetical protein